jgi:hypothetical protein
MAKGMESNVSEDESDTTSLDDLVELLTPKFGKVGSLTCGSNAVRNPSGRRKVSS